MISNTNLISMMLISILKIPLAPKVVQGVHLKLRFLNFFLEKVILTYLGQNIGKIYVCLGHFFICSYKKNILYNEKRCNHILALSQPNKNKENTQKKSQKIRSKSKLCSHLKKKSKKGSDSLHIELW
jgi:hypothetical protein